MTISARSRAVLRSVNWFWPAYMRRGYMLDLIARLEAIPQGPARTQAFEAALAPMYSPGHLAAMQLDRYAHVPLIALFRRQISEAIESAHLGLYHAAVAVLIPTVEGIVREHATRAGRDLRNADRNRLGIEIQAMVVSERQAHPGCTASDERVAMLEMFGEFLTDSLYMHTAAFGGDRELNRHGAIHGLYRDYGSAANFYILMSVVDLLTFILTFRMSGVSMLAPDMTLPARRLGLYYVGLREVARQAARVAGAPR